METPSNYDAYEGYISSPTSSHIIINNTSTSANVANINIEIGKSFQVSFGAIA